MQHFARLIVTLVVALFTTSALAGTYVSQRLLVTDKDQPTKRFDIEWSIDAKGFRVEARQDSELRYFIFNGRVFFVCGRISEEQAKWLVEMKFDDQQTMTKLRAGACQEVSADFALRFYLSPWDAIASPDTGSGMLATTAALDIETKLTGVDSTFIGLKCSNVSYTFKLSSGTSTEAYAEISCNSLQFDWRSAIARQLSTNLVRSSGGQKNAAAVRRIGKDIPGIALTANGTITGQNAPGQSIKRTVELTTQRVVGGDVAAAALSFPKGFEVIDPKALGRIATLASSSSDKKQTAVAAKSATDSSSIQQASAEALLRFLILGGNPVTTFVWGVSNPDSPAAKEREKEKQ